ncbi:MAG: DUF2238 domain-containing protein, partial [Bacteroidetes bacterium CG_4_9_14_3_um_filter_41_19]
MNYLKSLMILFFAVLIWSAINPHDYFTWFLEVLPALIGLLVLVITFQRFRFTNLVYGLILVHCWILMVGGHYTYAEVPLFNWIKQVFDLSRNNYDKVGHLVQGFVPAMITREILVRKQVVNSRKWINVFVVSICMSISVTYEFIEWLVAVLNGDSADSFLGTQGYI